MSDWFQILADLDVTASDAPSIAELAEHTGHRIRLVAAKL